MNKCTPGIVHGSRASTSAVAVTCVGDRDTESGLHLFSQPVCGVLSWSVGYERRAANRTGIYQSPEPADCRSGGILPCSLMQHRGLVVLGVGQWLLRNLYDIDVTLQAGPTAPGVRCSVSD